MNVRIHERFRFIVESENGNGEYLVDVLAYNGIGACDCWDFRARKEPEIVRVHPLLLDPNKDRTLRLLRCKHIKAADEELLWLFKKQAWLHEQEKAPRLVTDYDKAKHAFLCRSENFYCHACVVLGVDPTPTCDVHHRRGRAGGLLLDERFWTPVCRSCHHRIHADSGWAKSVGLIESWHNTKDVDNAKRLGNVAGEPFEGLTNDE